MFIHATNSTGAGASQVIISFIEAAKNLGLLESSKIYLPAIGPLNSYSLDNLNITRYKRLLPNSISRAIECLFAGSIFPKNQLAVVLGDIPLRGIKNQIVLVHQQNLVSPIINPASDNSFKSRIYRALFKLNQKYAKKIVVQTEVIAHELAESYPSISDKIMIIPQPIPSNFHALNTKINRQDQNGLIRFFYPAAGYPYKNHKFLIKIHEYFKNNHINNIDFEVWLTLSPDEFIPFKNIPFVKNLGKLDYEQVIKAYEECDALLFLSLSESYGLPLLEAMSLSLPIVACEQPYSKWMCNNNAFYFKSDAVESFLLAKNHLVININEGITPDYSNELQKFPESWNDVVLKFLS